MARPNTYAPSVWLPTKSADLEFSWVGAVDGSANVANPGDTANNVEMELGDGAVWTQATAGARPVWAADGSYYFAGGDRLTIPSSTARLKDMHWLGIGDFLLAVKLDAPTGSLRYLMGTNNLSSSSHGWALTIDNDGTVRSRSRQLTGYNLACVAPTPITDTNWHIIRGRLSPFSNSWVQVDRGAKGYANWTAARTDTNHSLDVQIGARSDGTFPLAGYVADAVVVSGRYFTDAEVFDWLQRNAALIGGHAYDAAFHFGKMYYEPSQNRAWTLGKLSYRKSDTLIYPLVNGDISHQGTVIKVDPRNPQGDKNLVGSGHGNESATKATLYVDRAATAFAAGVEVLGEEEVIFTRHTLLNTNTMRLVDRMYSVPDGVRHLTSITRLDPAVELGADGAAYILLGTRDNDLNLYAAFDAGGVLIEDGDLSEKTNPSDWNVPTGTRSFVVFDPVNEIGLITTLVDPGPLTPTMFIGIRTEDYKFYGDMTGLNDLPAGGVATTLWDVRVFESSEADFIADATPLVALALAPDDKHPMLLALSRERL